MNIIRNPRIVVLVTIYSPILTTIRVVAFRGLWVVGFLRSRLPRDLTVIPKGISLRYMKELQMRALTS